MTEKTFISPNKLMLDSFMLAKQIYNSDFTPEIIVVLWRGGSPVGMAVHEFLLYKGIKTYHTIVKTESYTGIGSRAKVKVEHPDTLLSTINTNSNVLVIDDIFDSGHTMLKINELLSTRTSNIKLAALYYKQNTNQTRISPDFFVRKTEQWLVFPHELMDLTQEEIKRKDPEIFALLEY